MLIGVFAKTFSRDSLEANLDAVLEAGFQSTQYNLSCAGLPTLPDSIRAELCARVGRGHRERGLSMAAISGTFNIIDHDLAKRRRDFMRFCELGRSAEALGTTLITVCSGSSHPHDMWSYHPENSTDAAWQHMVTSMSQLATIAAEFNVCIGVEPEPSNVIDSAPRARKLIDELGSPYLRIVLDPANLISGRDPEEAEDILQEAVELLAHDTALVHAKQFADSSRSSAEGPGTINYAQLLRNLRVRGFDGPIIIHGVPEPRLPSCRDEIIAAIAASRNASELATL